ncbi:hypothetical protein ACFLU6_08555 [Acidobacteriota bacterium]
MNELAATMIKDEKNIQCGEMDCRDDEEIEKTGKNGVLTLFSGEFYHST